MLKLFLSNLFVILSATSAFAQNVSLIKSTTVIRGDSSAPQRGVDVEITDGRISRIGPNLTNTKAVVIDGNGLYLMPGLIDCHTHLRSVPGVGFRNESADATRGQQQRQMKAYLAAGVTTVLDAAASESLFDEIKKMESVKNHLPRVVGLAPFLTPENGYFAKPEARGKSYSDLWAPVHDSVSIAQHFEKASRLNSLGVKVTFEAGFGPFAIWPVFDENLRRTIVAEAKKYHLPIFAHSMSYKEHRLALSVKPYALVHAGFDEKAADETIVQEIKDSNAYVVTTLAIYKMMLLIWSHELFSDPWFQMLVPKEQLVTALDPQVAKQVVQEVVAGGKPSWVPKSVATFFAPWFLNESIVKKNLSNSMQSVRLMYQKGVPIVMGSDSGNWPLWTTFFHGVGSILEMNALEEAGMPTQEIIQSATSRAAKMLKIDAEVGTVAVGKTADLILMAQNPLDSTAAFRQIKWVIRGGVIKQPKEWMKDPL